MDATFSIFRGDDGGADESQERSPAPQHHALPPSAVQDEIRDLVVRAKKGDAQVLPRIRELLDAFPGIWKRIGDLSALAENSWITVIAASEPVLAESIKKSIAEMKAGLLGERSGQLEKLLTDQIVAAWLELKCQEVAASRDSSSQRLKRLESANKRYLEAVKTLTSLRALVPEGFQPLSGPRLHRTSRHA